MAAKAAGTGYRSALQHRDFRWLISSLIVDQSGSWAYNVALSVYVFDATHSAGWVAAVNLCRFVPMLLLSSYAGVLADRFERTRLLIISSLLSFTWMVALSVSAALHAPVGLALVFAVFAAISGIVYTPAVTAMFPQLVSERDLAAANALNSSVDNGAVIIGPAIGAGLVFFGGPVVAFAVNALTFLYAAYAVSRLEARSEPVDVTEGGGAGPLRQMQTGLKMILHSRDVALLVGFSALASFIYGTDTVLFVVLSEKQLGTGSTGYGYLLAGLGLGGVLAAAAVNRLASHPRLGLIITLGMATYCLPTAVMIWVHTPAIAFVLEVIRGAGTLVVDVLAITSLHRSVPRDVLARVFGVFFAIVVAAIALGSLIAAPVLHIFGLHGALLTFGLIVPLIVMLGYPTLRKLDQKAVSKLAELAPRIALLEHLGMFAAATRPVLEALADATTDVEAAPSTIIVAEGEPADALYILVSGEVAVDARGEADESRRIRTLEAPAYFGEIGLLRRVPRTATVTALEACRLYRIEGTEFLEALTEARAGSVLLEGAQRRLALTHPVYAAEPASD
ncbi:MAG: MFS transporter [Mycobacteriales bacterium]